MISVTFLTPTEVGVPAQWRRVRPILSVSDPWTYIFLNVLTILTKTKNFRIFFATLFFSSFFFYKFQYLPSITIYLKKKYSGSLNWLAESPEWTMPSGINIRRIVEWFWQSLSKATATLEYWNGNRMVGFNRRGRVNRVEEEYSF